MAFDIDTMFNGKPRMLNIGDDFDIDTMFDGKPAMVIPSGGTPPTGWTGIILGHTNPGKINGIAVANITKVNGVS